MSLIDYRPQYLTLDERDGAVVVRFRQSELTEEENIEQIGYELFSLPEQFDCSRLVLDLGNVTLMSSSALGKMITLHRKLHRREGKLVLCHIRGGVAEIMSTSRLIDYFHVADTLGEALEAVQGSVESGT